MKSIIVMTLMLVSGIGYAQQAKDLFSNSGTPITWLGIDFSHVKLIGEFSHFASIGEKSSSQIKNHYFEAWNKLIINEREKYDIKGMLRKDEIFYDIDMVDDLNDDAPLDDMESYNNPRYSSDSILSFVKQYNFKNRDGIGVMLVAESLNKAENVAYFHFVAINMSTKEVLVQERLRGEPRGFGIRNYWAGAIYDVLHQVGINYKSWRADFAGK